jgi:hypothetical protein
MLTKNSCKNILYLDCDSCLLILVSSEDLRFFGWDNSVPRNQLCHHSTNGFDTKSERGHIQEKDI